MGSAMVRIKSLVAREILDSRGNPTLEVDALLSNGAYGSAAVPSGASTGSREALELRDAEPKRYGGKRVLHAGKNVNETPSLALIGVGAFGPRAPGQAMIGLDGAPVKRHP